MRSNRRQEAAKPLTRRLRAAAADVNKAPPLTAPITVSGRATDAAGRSISGATIYLVSTGSTNAPLGTTTSAPNGTYTFRDAHLPVSRGEDDVPSQGAIQVFGTAPGYGFAWHGMRAYLPALRPANLKIAGEDHSIYEGEPLVMDLRFGRFRDERADSG